MQEVAWMKLYSIVRLIAAIILIIFAHYVSDHAAEGVERLNEAFTFSSGINKLIFEGFVKWDSVHYLNIALKGYQNDYQFVFYPLYPLLLRYFEKIVLFTHFNSFEHILFFALLLNQLLGLSTAAVAITPCILFSHVGYEFICSEDKWSRLHRDYCVDSEANSMNKLRLYNILQQKYWNVSFLNSYQIRQIPNIMLALPVIAISTYTLISSFNDKDRDLVLVSSNTPFSHNSLLPWKIHLFVHLLIGLFWAHIQVSTRLILSSSPLIYVGLAKLLTSKGKARSLTIAYLIIYMLIGSILHTNYYPWT
eukprot:gene799-852_t